MLLGWATGIELLTRRGVSFRPTVPIVAVGHLVMGAALALPGLPRHGSRPRLIGGLCAVAVLLIGTSALAQVLALGTLLVSLFSLTGHAYRARELYAVGPYTPMALPSAVAFFALAAGVLSARPGQGPMSVVTRDDFGGYVARRLLPAALLIPFLLGWGRLLGGDLTVESGVGKGSTFTLRLPRERPAERDRVARDRTPRTDS